jgi:type VI secretion system protein ImpK
VQAASLPLLERISAALRAESGSLRVIDHTDNQQIRTVQFPSNFQLSAARANAVGAIVARNVGDPARVSVEGRADADPIAPNTTAEGREQNRRIEIVLHRQN